ncbi:MAG TPA: hypothetical protein VF042_16185 [Gemmatimonadaceae bacterium]
MKTALGSLAFALAATAALAACGNNSKSIGDVLAEDTTLAREVMSARGDTLAQPVETGIAEELAAAPSDPIDEVPAQAAGPVISSPVATTPSHVGSPAPAESATAPRSVAAAAPTQSTRKVVRRTAVARSTPSRTNRVVKSRISDIIVSSSRETTNRTRESRRTTTTPMRSSALLPAGLEFSLASDQRVCASMSRVGDKFYTHLSEDVVGPIGVVLPKGTPAIARVVSTKGDMDLVIESLTFTEQHYAPETLVTYAETEKVGYPRHTARNATAGAGLGAAIGAVAGGGVQGALIGAAGGAAIGTIASRPKTQKDRCIPAGGDITARLVEPLKITL